VTEASYEEFAARPLDLAGYASTSVESVHGHLTGRRRVPKILA